MMQRPFRSLGCISYGWSKPFLSSNDSRESLVEPIHVDAASSAESVGNVENVSNLASNVIDNATKFDTGLVDNVAKFDTGVVEKIATDIVKKNPYGPWLMVLYERQGNQNSRGNAGKNVGSASGMRHDGKFGLKSGLDEKSRNAGKNMGNSCGRRYDGTNVNAKTDFKNGNAKSGMLVKPAVGRKSPVSGLSPPRPEALGGAREQNPSARCPDPTPLTAKRVFLIATGVAVSTVVRIDRSRWLCGLLQDKICR
ncbi:hypothetical protein LWI28_004954 [Acer negundo]|uniref:Uncharacterized protein n=1 Tax=Acer negundo TaxID=4023 RepID=A0AAD5P249_ACENE|nr:hypothetical protein LWI28_004954 [Acer negundo]